MPAYSQLECAVPLTQDYLILLHRFFRAVGTALGRPVAFESWLRDLQLSDVQPADPLHGFQFAPFPADHQTFTVTTLPLRCRPVAMGWGPPAFKELDRYLLAMQLCFCDEDIWEPPPDGRLCRGVPDILERAAVLAHRALDGVPVFFTDEVSDGLPAAAAWLVAPTMDVWKGCMAVSTPAWLAAVPTPPPDFTQRSVDETTVLWRSSVLPAE